MARGWKRAVEVVAARSGAARLARRWRDPTTVVLAYHNIVPRGESAAGDVSLHVDQATFGAQLDVLLETHEVVALDRLVGSEDPPDTARRSRAAITFDDAYSGTLTAGVEELRRRALPATVFVPPALLGAAGFWWDLLAPASGGPLAPTTRAHALTTLGGCQDRVLAWAKAEGLTIASLPEHARPGDETAVVEAASKEGITLGAHTWSHPNLVALDADELRSELQRSRAWLRSLPVGRSDWLAYPYGLHSAEVVAATRELFTGALRIDGGLAASRGRATTPRYLVPRLNVPRGLTLEGLSLRLAGLLG